MSMPRKKWDFRSPRRNFMKAEWSYGRKRKKLMLKKELMLKKLMLKGDEGGKYWDFGIS